MKNANRVYLWFCLFTLHPYSYFHDKITPATTRKQAKISKWLSDYIKHKSNYVFGEHRWWLKNTLQNMLVLIVIYCLVSLKHDVKFRTVMAKANWSLTVLITDLKKESWSSKWFSEVVNNCIWRLAVMLWWWQACQKTLAPFIWKIVFLVCNLQ